jgi:hypothetical protein
VLQPEAGAEHNGSRKDGERSGISFGFSCLHMKAQGSRAANGINGYSSGAHIEFSHSLVWRCVQRYGPEINKRIRPHLKMSGTSYRVDETYIKVGKSCNTELQNKRRKSMNSS